jgi:positive phototaxis protein PixI
MISEFTTRGIVAGNPNAEEAAGSKQQFLRLHLPPDTTAMLPLSQIAEVLTVPTAQIVPIPHLPAWVMGVYNWRGEILWIVDLGHTIGQAPLYQQGTSRSSYTAVVIHGTQQVAGGQQADRKTGKKVLGLLVNRVEDMEWCNPDNIQSPPASAVTPELVPYLRGYWLKPNGEILVVLDGDSIIAGMPQPKTEAS